MFAKKLKNFLVESIKANCQTKMPKYTRYLYDVDHVVAALSVAIIAQSDFDEVLFWADELHSSGFPEMLTAVIWSCFYGHFAAVNPLMEKYILRKLAADDPWSVLKNLFHRQKYQNSNETSTIGPKRGRKPKWLDEFTDNKHIKNVLVSPCTASVAEYAKHHTDLVPLYTTLLAFYTSTDAGDVTFFASHSRQTQYLFILAMVRMMSLPEEEIHTKKIYLVLSDADVWFLGYIRDDIDTEGRKVPAYKLLNERRLFPGGGVSFTGNIWESKEMLCETPLWRDRFSLDEEKFCEMYDYQPDDYCRRVM
jgi:hypothetical protein